MGKEVRREGEKKKVAAQRGGKNSHKSSLRFSKEEKKEIFSRTT